MDVITDHQAYTSSTSTEWMSKVHHICTDIRTFCAFARYFASPKRRYASAEVYKNNSFVMAFL